CAHDAPPSEVADDRCRLEHADQERECAADEPGPGRRRRHDLAHPIERSGDLDPAERHAGQQVSTRPPRLTAAMPATRWPAWFFLLIEEAAGPQTSARRRIDDGFRVDPVDAIQIGDI